MKNDNDKLGHINVEMGDGNLVGHIGHKITYHAPAPPANAIHQNGNFVGTFDGQPGLVGDRYNFSKLFVEIGFNKAAEFEIQGVRLVIEKIDAATSASIGGRPQQRTLYNAVCRVL